MKNIYLVGMMGSGKSSTGRELARLLSLSFVDLDDWIEAQARKSVNEIFESEGEAYFRKLESELLNQVSSRTDQIVATGGGVVLNPANRDVMRKSGTVFYLKASLEMLWERVKHNRTRPLLATADPKASLADLFRRRTPLYETVADGTVVTDQKSPESAAREIYEKYFKG